MAVRFARCRELFDEKFERVTKARILIIGVGGVGSYALDCLYRSGVGHITIVDYDSYETSNLNRQIGSDNAIGKCKVSTLSKLYPGIETIKLRVDTEWVANFDFDAYDLVIDACDSRAVKVELALKCWRKLLMSMGSAKRIDASKVQSASIWKSHGDPFARKIRNELKKRRFERNFTVVFSPETPYCKGSGSFAAVTGTFGLFLCSEASKRVVQ